MRQINIHANIVISGDFNVPFGTQEKEACAMEDFLMV